MELERPTGAAQGAWGERPGLKVLRFPRRSLRSSRGPNLTAAPWILVVLALIAGSLSSQPIEAPRTSFVAAQEQDLVFDHAHAAWTRVLGRCVKGDRFDYKALAGSRGPLDEYLLQLRGVQEGDFASWTREERLAFWINAYNAFVLRTVIDFYPINGRAAIYPRNSIRQVPGAFEKRPFRAAGRTVTLDQIEKEITAPLADARALLAPGRGALSGGRLRSEAYTAERLEAQLDATARAH